jgi:hypothetical protein
MPGTRESGPIHRHAVSRSTRLRHARVIKHGGTVVSSRLSRCRRTVYGLLIPVGWTTVLPRREAAGRVSRRWLADGICPAVSVGTISIWAASVDCGSAITAALRGWCVCPVLRGGCRNSVEGLCARLFTVERDPTHQRCDCGQFQTLHFILPFVCRQFYDSRFQLADSLRLSDSATRITYATFVPSHVISH